MFKKLGHKLRKVKKLGNKVVHHTAVGARKMGGVATKAGEVMSAVGMASGQPELVSVGKQFEETGQKVRQVARGVEKIRKGKVQQGGEMVGSAMN